MNTNIKFGCLNSFKWKPTYICKKGTHHKKSYYYICSTLALRFCLQHATNRIHNKNNYDYIHSTPPSIVLSFKLNYGLNSRVKVSLYEHKVKGLVLS